MTPVTVMPYPVSHNALPCITISRRRVIAPPTSGRGVLRDDDVSVDGLHVHTFRYNDEGSARFNNVNEN